MKNLEKIKGIKALDKKEQQSVKGGKQHPCYVECPPDLYCSGFVCYMKE